MSPTALSQIPAAGILNEVPVSHPIPTSMELHRILNQMLVRRYNLSAQYVHSLTDEVPNLPEEHSIYFMEPFGGLLVVRSRAEFEKFLQSSCQESLLDLTILFYHQLFLGAWNLDPRQSKSALFKRSIPATWPDRSLDSGCLVFVKDHPVGIRLWTGVSEQEMENWRAYRK